MTRGLRNNNPGNIRRSTTPYKGEIVGEDTAFKTFQAMQWGYRAMFVLLHTYQKRYGLNTIAGVIRRYAPANENNTEAYIATVARLSKMDANAGINTQHKATMIPIVAAMSRVENGVDAVPADVLEGWNLFEQHQP